MSQPMPHPEVVNGQPSVLIVGYGRVGQQIGRYFTEADYVDLDGVVMHKHPEYGDMPAARVPGYYDLGFVCVNTPELPDGSCDLSAVKSAYAKWCDYAKYWCLKSTVPPGTTESLGKNVCMSPEYLGETILHPFSQPTNSPFVILGGPKEVRDAFAEAWSLVTYSRTHFYFTDSRTAELAKLMENTFIGLKVCFIKQFRDLAEAAGISWHELRELWLADSRVSRDHTYSYETNPGFGGKCIPKDTANLCAWARTLGMSADLVEGVRRYNAGIREGMNRGS